MGKGGLFVRFLARTPVSADETQAGAVLAGSEITALDLASFATIACLANAGALLGSICLRVGGRIVCGIGTIPFT